MHAVHVWLQPGSLVKRLQRIRNHALVFVRQCRRVVCLSKLWWMGNDGGRGLELQLYNCYTLVLCVLVLPLHHGGSRAAVQR